jgi:hypothetical protein
MKRAAAVRLKGWIFLVLGAASLITAGFWPGAFPALAALLWLGLSARRSTQRRRMTLAA